MIEARMRLPASLLESLDFLARGDLARADTAASSFADAYPDAAEAEVLRALIERRKVQEPWLDSFLNAWASVGRPTAFELFRNERREEWVQHLARSITEEKAFPTSASHSPLMALIVARAPNLDREMRRAVEGSERATSVVDCLWYLTLTNDRRVSKENVQLAARARSRLLKRLVELRPDDFVIRALEILEPGDQTRLNARATEALLQQVDKCCRALELAEIYQPLKTARSSETSTQRRVCLEDAMVMQPSVLLSILARAQASANEPHSDQLNVLLQRVGERFSTARTMADRLCALRMVELAQQNAGRSLELDEAHAKLERARWVARPEHRLNLDWPLEPLAREVCDAVAEDEFGVSERCLFPTS